MTPLCFLRNALAFSCGRAFVLQRGSLQGTVADCLSALVTEFGKECKKCKRLRKNMATKKAELSGTVGS